MQERAPVDRPPDDPVDPGAQAAAAEQGTAAEQGMAAKQGTAAEEGVPVVEGGGATSDVPDADGGPALGPPEEDHGEAELPRQRSSRRPRDMVISLAVLVVPVLVIIGGYQVLSGRTSPVEVDPEPALNSAAVAGMEVARPEGLPEGWVPVSAVFQPAEEDETGDTLRIGYVTPDGASVQVVQSTVPAEELLPAELPDAAAPAGSLDLAGEPWQQYEGSGGNQALVLLEADHTTIVRGAASQDELTELAASLR